MLAPPLIPRLAASLLLSLAASLGAAHGAEWREGSALGQARADMAGAALGDEVFIAGGSNISGPTQSFEVYDVIGDLWRSLPPVPEGIQQAALAPLAGKLYVTGGLAAREEGTVESAATWIFDPHEAVWRPGPDLPRPRVDHGMAELGGRLYVVGGRGPEAGRVFTLAPDGKRWEEGPPLPTPRAGLQVVSTGERLYAIGGRTPEGQDSGAVESLATEGGWTRLESLPEPRSGHMAALLEGAIYVLGGERMTPLQTFADTFVYDIAAGGWSRGPALPTPRHGGVATAVNGELVIIGGGAGAGVYAVFTASDAVTILTR